MKPAGHIARTFALLTLFQTQTDEEHRLSMNDLIAELDDQGISAERKAISRSIKVLQENGYDIRYSRKGGTPSYYLRRSWTPAEVLVLRDAVRDSFSLSKAASEALIKKLEQELSSYQQRQLPVSPVRLDKTDNTQVLDIITLLISAIAKRQIVEFCYYDLTVTRQKRYRRNRATYRYLPVSILENSGRYYCVFYSSRHQNFANYRIDKMTSVTVSDEIADPVRFDAERWAQTAFQMYHGEPVTIQLKCDNSLIPIVFDQFGKDVLISEADEQTFTVHLKSSVTPTLVSWVLMFYDRIQVLGPQELIQQLLTIADSLQRTYLGYNTEKEASHEQSRRKDPAASGNH